MTTGTLKIHSENILPIIKKWLYSDKEIFLRELVSNACDAMSKTQVLADKGEATIAEDELQVQITTKDSSIIISDGGIGMNTAEIEKYIAQLAFSGAEEFIEKYKDADEKEQIIGHFGLGFYSAFMVSKEVEIDSKSYSDAPAAHWKCDGSSDYEMSEGTRKERGTDITLHISEDSKEFLEESRLRGILEKHCRFLPFPIFLNGKKINEKEPLWNKPASECTDEEYLEFYRYLYPMDQDPIFWIHLNVDYPFNLKGILYFPKIHKRMDVNQPSVHLYCNRVFVSDNCKDLIPDYLTVLRGVIDSPDIPLNVSRSYLQMDSTVRQLASHISKKVSDKLGTIYKTEKETFVQKWPDIEMIVKLGVLQDEKFYGRVQDFLIWKNTEGEWTTANDYVERHPDSKIYYTSHPEEHSTDILQAYKDKGIEVLFAPQYLDTPLINFLEMKMEGKKFQRVDGGIDDALLDGEAGEHDEAIQQGFSDAIGKEKLTVEVKSLSSANIPALVVLKEESRRMRDYLAMTGNEFPGNLMDEHTLVLNTKNPTIASFMKLKDKDEPLAKKVATHIYESALLTQKELDPSQMNAYLSRANEVLEALLQNL